MHNELAECWRSMLQEAQEDVSDAESANWFQLRPDKHILYEPCTPSDTDAAFHTSCLILFHTAVPYAY